MDYGSQRQQVECAYQLAWTLYWWLEDPSAFMQQYRIVEERAADSLNVFDFERLSNLWYLLVSPSFQGILKVDDLGSHTEKLQTELTRLSEDADRPSTALQAETLLLQIDLVTCFRSDEPVEQPLRQLHSVVQRSEGLIGYPLEPLVDVLSEVGSSFEGSEAFEELFETIVGVTSAREGDVKAARLLFKRGQAQLNTGRSIEAIATLGRSMQLLTKHESRFELVNALYLCGRAYEQAGLLWAARGTFITAASIAVGELWRFGTVTPHQALITWKLKWLELRMGRLPQTLAWHEVAQVVEDAWIRQQDDPPETPGDSAFDLLVARGMLRLERDQLLELQDLPHSLDRLHLRSAAASLRFALGHTEELTDVAEQLGEGATAHQLAVRLRNSSTDHPVAAELELYGSGRIVLRSTIIGCQISVESTVDPPCLEVAESFLAALEGLLATSLQYGVFTGEPECRVEVVLDSEAEVLLQWKMDELNSTPRMVLTCSEFSPHSLGVSEIEAFSDQLFQAITELGAHLFIFKDPENDIRSLLLEEKAADRAISFTRTIGTQTEVLGREPKSRLESWLKNEGSGYPLVREVAWDIDESAVEESVQGSSPSKLTSQDGSGAPASGLPQASHSNVSIISPIRNALWDRAGWSAVAFLSSSGTQPPVLALVLRDKEAGAEIFRLWRQEYGETDNNRVLRVAVVRGIDSRRPHDYRIVVGANPQSALVSGNPYFMLTYRLHTMNPTDATNLERFLSEYRAAESFVLAPAFIRANWDGESFPEADPAMGIGIRELHVHYAWQLGPQDIDAVAIWPDDTPVIPDDTEAPVIELLEKLKSDQQ